MNSRVIGSAGTSLLTRDLPFETIAAEVDAAMRTDGVAPRPVKRDTKSTGDRSEAIVLAALVNKGYVVSIPFGENQRYDLVIDDGETLSRVQVKTGRVRGDVIKYNCSSSHAHRRGTTRPYFGQIEYLAVCCPDTGKVYLLPEEQLTATGAHLRLSPPRNNMRKSIRWAAKYELA